MYQWWGYFITGVINDSRRPGCCRALKKAVNCLAAPGAGEMLKGPLACSADELTNGGWFAWMQTWVLENGAGTALTNSAVMTSPRRR